jgi:hypothetical protein
MINNAGILIISLTRMSGEDEKCSLITPKAGATAAPAITVRSEIDRIVVLICFEGVFIKNCFI